MAGTVAEVQSIIDRLAEQTTLMNVRDVAELLGDSEETIRRRVRRRLIPAFRLGHKTKFDPAQVAKWLRSHTVR